MRFTMRSMFVLACVAAVAPPASSARAAAASLEAAPADVCRRADLAESPGWVSSLVQSPDGRSLLVTAPRAGEIVRYDLDGRLEGRIAGMEGEDRFRPSAIRRVDGSYLLETEQARFVRLDEAQLLGERPAGGAPRLLSKARVSSLQATRAPRDLAGWAPESAGQIGAVYDWAVLPGGSLVAFADVLRHDGRWASAVIRGSLDAPRSFAVAREIPLDAPARTWFLYQRPAIAVAGDRAYVLVLGERPGVYALTAGDEPALERVLPLPSRVAAVPELPAPGGAEGVTRVFGALARSTAAAGLYSDGEALYLLERTFDRTDDTRRWFLTRIEPGAGGEARETGTVRLPTSAPHVTLAPGARNWVILERGEVTGFLEQALEGLVTVPAAWITEGGSPLRPDVFRASLCR